MRDEPRDPLRSRDRYNARHATHANAGSSMRWFAAFLVGRRGARRHRDLCAGRAQPRARRRGAAGGGARQDDSARSRSGRSTRPPPKRCVGPRVTVAGWALDPAGMRAVEIRVDGTRVSGANRHRAARRRQGQARRLPNNANGGFEFTGDFVAHRLRRPARTGAMLSIVAIANDGRERVLGTRYFIEPARADALDRVQRARTRRRSICCPRCRASTSAALPSSTRCTRLTSRRRCASGFRVPILYLRMTKGAAADYAFDPDWDPKRKCGERRIGDDSLNARARPLRRRSGCRCSSR